ncbi:MAG: hypothetical protein INR68_06555 [Methylobacterium mesophilicum]|nr:hypothetical protein [Methylobacterium mesophilicum]
MSFLFRISLGLIVWAAGFSLVYALHGMGCALGWPQTALGPFSLFRWVLLGGWALTLAAGVAVVAWNLRLGISGETGRFETRLARISAFAGLGATAVSCAPIAFSAACV